MLTEVFQISPKQIDYSHKQGELRNITYSDINEILTFTPNQIDDTTKVRFSWGFEVFMPDGTVHQCSIWDWKGSWQDHRFSTYGPAFVFEELFGSKAQNSVW